MRLLFVDDERDLVSSLSRYFRLHGFETAGAYGVADAVARLEEARAGASPYDAVVTDLRMPDGDGLTVLREVRRLLPRTPVVVMTAFGSVATSVEAMRLGAVTMLKKPVPVAQLEREVRDAIADAHEVEGGLEAAGDAGLVGGSTAIRELFDTLVRVAPSNSSVLIQGESGTGKELVAQAVHRLSRRALGPLVAVNCAAIPEPLLESELFGHVKGAFTGASQTRQGRFKLAHNGTIFLDEIGEMPRPLHFSEEALGVMERYGWPGNVRELENLVERLAVLKVEGQIGLSDLPGPIRNAKAVAAAEGVPTTLPPEGVDLYKVLADLEDRLIREALGRSGGNKQQAAKILGLNRTTLVEKLRKKGGLKGPEGSGTPN